MLILICQVHRFVEAFIQEVDPQESTFLSTRGENVEFVRYMTEWHDNKFGCH